MASMSSHTQNDFVSREFLAAANALSLTALNDMPGGSISPFCAPPTVTSTPHSSWRYSVEASDAMVSTRNSAGWPAATIALRLLTHGDSHPAEEPLCSTSTGLLSVCVSIRTY